MTTDAATTEFVVTQTTFYLAFLISLGTAGAIIANVVRGINNRVKRNREEVEAKEKAERQRLKEYVDDRMKEVTNVRDRVEYIYRKIVDQYVENKKDGKS
jgi:hypothetical protein